MSEAPQQAPGTREQLHNKLIGDGWGISIAVVIAMIAAAVANVRMMSSNNERTIALETKIDGTNKTLDKIEAAVTSLTSTTQQELSAMKAANADLRERVARDVGDLRVQIAEIRAALMAQGK